MNSVRVHLDANNSVTIHQSEYKVNGSGDLLVVKGTEEAARFPHGNWMFVLVMEAAE